MRHLFKVENEFADIFIEEVTNTSIKYEVRHKENGQLLEPPRTSPYFPASDGLTYFDERHISTKLLMGIAQLLQSQELSSQAL